jgi:hypothetical protein
MKKLITLVMLAVALLINTKSNAQVSLNVNIGSQPLWGPTGYDHVDYYYLPDIDTYYNVPTHEYVYLNNGAWVTTSSLPARYSSYNLYNGYKVVLNGSKPYLNYNSHKVKYAKYKNWGGKQLVIKNSNDKKYYVVKGHPHGAPPGQVKKAYNGVGNGKGNGGGNGKAQGGGKGNGGGNGKGKH